MREDLPLPTEPPFTAFVGNLAFDITESELEEFFEGKVSRLVSSHVIRISSRIRPNRSKLSRTETTKRKVLATSSLLISTV